MLSNFGLEDTINHMFFKDLVVKNIYLVFPSFLVVQAILRIAWLADTSLQDLLPSLTLYQWCTFYLFFSSSYKDKDFCRMSLSFMSYKNINIRIYGISVWPYPNLIASVMIFLHDIPFTFTGVKIHILGRYSYIQYQMLSNWQSERL